MPTELSLEHTWPWPAWIAVIGFLVVVGLAIALYRRELGTLGGWPRGGLAVARIGLLGVLLWMMWGWQRQPHRTEPAELLVAVDDSISMTTIDVERDARLVAKRKSRGLSNDLRMGASRFDLARSLVDHPKLGWLASLAKQHRVRTVLLGEPLRDAATSEALRDATATRPESRLGESVRELLANRRGRPTTAIVVLTDGVTTSGPTLAEAAETARRHAIPLFLVGTGSDQLPRDLRLADLRADEVTFTDDLVVLEAQLQVTGLSGQATTVRLRRSDTGATLAEQIVAVESEAMRRSIRLGFRPRESGEIPLVLEAAPLIGEVNVDNNRLTHALIVTDAEIKVLLVHASPSYEFRYLKNLLDRTTTTTADRPAARIKLTTVLQEADREYAEQDTTAAAIFPPKRDDLFAFDVVIFGDVDPTLLGRAAAEHLVAFVRERNKSILFVAGPRFTPHAFRDSPLASLFPFAPDRMVTAIESPAMQSFVARLTPVGAVSSACQLELEPAANQATWQALPGLFWFAEIREPHPAARVLLEHPTRTTIDGRKLPIVLTQFVGAGRVAFHATDETYRWARFDGNDEFYARFWLQTIRSLARNRLLAGRSTAEITTDRQQYQIGDAVRIRVRFLAERDDSTTVSVLVEETSTAKSLPLVHLSREASDAGSFSGELPNLIPGTYRVSLVAPTLDPQPPSRSFVIEVPKQEPTGVPLNVADMRRAAEVSGGRYYHWSDAERLPRDLPHGQRVRVESLPPRPIWNSTLVALLFVVILTGEWLMRRRFGLL